MTVDHLTLRLVGGPTAVFEYAGLRWLTDPTFSPPGEYGGLVKTTGPALGFDELGPIDVVLLSHDQHPDNLDPEGRACLPRAGRVLTTTAGAERLGGNAIGLAPWSFLELDRPDGGMVTVTELPALHGPEGSEWRGPIGQNTLAWAPCGNTVPESRCRCPGESRWLLRQQELEAEHERKCGTAGKGDNPRRRRFERIGEQLPEHHPHHCACRESQPDGEDRREGVDEQERGDGEKWLRQAREDAPSRRSADRGAARNEDETDGEPLGDVVHSDRDRDQQTKR